MADIDDYLRGFGEYENRRRLEQAELVERVQRDGVDATMERLEKGWAEMAKKSEAARRERDKLMGLSPADQHLITTLENKHVTLSEFQKMHGLEPDGILGPQTQKLIADLEYKRQNNAELDRLVELAGNENNNFADTISKMLRKPCTARAFARDINGRQQWLTCDKGSHDRLTVPHGVSFPDPHGGPEFRVRWRRDGDSFFQLARDGNWSETSESQWNSKALHTFAAESRVSVNRPQEFVQVRPMDATEAADHVIRAIDAATGHSMTPRGLHYMAKKMAANIEQDSYDSTGEDLVVTKSVSTPTPDVSKVMVSDLGRRRPREPLTREKYRTTFSEMQYTVIKSLYWGYRVIVSLARGGTRTSWAPTRNLAESIGTKRLKRELTKLTLMYERDNPTGVGARAVGMHFPMTTDEVTEMLDEQDKAARDAAQAEWDAEFRGEAS